MKDKLSELRECLRRKLIDDLQSASLTNLILRLVMPEMGRVLKEERDRAAKLADDMGAADLATMLRRGETNNVRVERDQRTRRLPFTQA